MLGFIHLPRRVLGSSAAANPAASERATVKGREALRSFRIIVWFSLDGRTSETLHAPAPPSSSFFYAFSRPSRPRAHRATPRSLSRAARGTSVAQPALAFSRSLPAWPASPTFARPTGHET